MKPEITIEYINVESPETIAKKEKDTQVYTFPNAPISKAKWKLQCALVDAEDSYYTLALHNSTGGKQGMAMNFMAKIINQLKDLIEQLTPLTLKEELNA